MGRFFNREAGCGALLLLLVGLVAALSFDVPIWAKVVIPVGVLAVFHWPLAIFAQDKFLEFYIERGFYDRALALALDIRESSLDRRSRQQAALNVAFVHMARGDYENALKNLRTIVTTKEHAALRSVVEGTMGYCLAQLGRDLPEAERLITASVQAQPKESIFTAFLALLRFRQGELAEAGALLDKSLALDPDPRLPHPGERAYLRALIDEGQGEQIRAEAQLRLAEQVGGRCHFGKLAAERLAALRRPDAAAGEAAQANANQPAALTDGADKAAS